MVSLFASFPPDRLDLIPKRKAVAKDYTKQPIPCIEACKMGSHMTDKLLVIIVGQVDMIPDS
jgi:hypothetical protein